MIKNQTLSRLSHPGTPSLVSFARRGVIPALPAIWRETLPPPNPGPLPWHLPYNRGQRGVLGWLGRHGWVLLAGHTTLSHTGLSFPRFPNWSCSHWSSSPANGGWGHRSQRGSPPWGCPHLSLTEGCDPTLQHSHQRREGALGARTWGLRGRGLGSARCPY